MLGKQRPSGLSTGLALCVLLAALSSACTTAEPRTQVMLIVDADQEVRARASSLTVEIESRGEFDHVEGPPHTESFATTEDVYPYWPYEIALLPRGNDARRSYRITATLYEGDEAIAVLRARSGFVAQRTIQLHLFFSADCLGPSSLGCHDDESCYLGECWLADIDAQALSELGSAAPTSDADGGIPNSSSAIQTSGQNQAEGGITGAGGMSGPGSTGTAGSGGAAGGDMLVRMSGGDCGDGQLNEGEECDTAIPDGMPGACPEQCTAVDACEPLHLEGAGCQAHCMGYRIQMQVSGDGCCPEGADASGDMDCSASCGNGILEAGETCDPIDTCPTTGSSCVGANACLVATVEGDAASCTAVCVMHPVQACMGADGCCPSECTHDSDSDCSASCGNGVVDEAAGELCEPTSPDRPCPSGCDDGDPCTEDILTGSASNCNATCTHTPITATINRDGCCPPGRGNANNDSDCEPMCGNGVVERGELCDGFCPTQASQCDDFNPCTVNGLAASPCGMRCSFQPILGAANGDMCCPFGANANNDSDCRPACGNGVVERGELCDGNCPTSCRDDGDNNPCTVNVVTNTGCQRRCEARTLRANTMGPDGCCPTGATPGTDSDCMGPPPPQCDPPTCDEPSGCTRFMLQGSGCDARCVSRTITTAMNGDGCCPNGENSSTDTDCTNPPVCDPPPCDDPTSGCTRFMLLGSGCDARCVSRTITTAMNGDGCCPDGQNSTTDNDCTNPPPPPQCDPPICISRGCMRSQLQGTGCDAECVESTITAPANGDDCCPPGQNSSTDTDCTNPPPMPEEDTP